MLEQPADVVHGHLAETAVLVACEEGLTVLPDALMCVHPGAVVLKNRLGHKGGRFPMLPGHVLDHVFEPHEVVGTLDQGRVLHVDLRLAGGGHFVVLGLYLYSVSVLEDLDHFHPDVGLAVVWRGGEVAAAVFSLVAQVGAFLAAGVPPPLHRINIIVTGLSILVEPDVVKNKELGLGTEESGIADARGFKVRFGLLGHEAGIPRIGLLGDRIKDVADHGQSGHKCQKGIHLRGGRVRDDQHVAGVDGLPPADRGTVKPEPLLKAALLKLLDWHTEMLPCSGQIHELEIYHLDAFFLRKFQYRFGCHF